MVNDDQRWSTVVKLFGNFLICRKYLKLTDRWICDLSGDGEFRVKEVRIFLDDLFLPSFSEPTRWVKCVPIKINIFAWRARRDCLPRRSNLARRGVSLESSRCPLCDACEEDIHHVWFSSIRILPKVKRLLEGVFYVAWWSIWNLRNRTVFDDIPPRRSERISKFPWWVLSRMKFGEMGKFWFLVIMSMVVAMVDGFPVEDLVVKLPGQPSVGFRQYGGYVDVDVKNGRSLFYYFVEADGGDADHKPLSLWLNGAKDMYTFLLNWYKKFPSFRTRDLYLTGESYAGHYIPQLAIALLDHNERSTGFKFNIKGVAIGNPLLKLDRDVPAVYEYYWSHGMISDEIGLTIMNDCNFEDYTFASPHNESGVCNDALSQTNNIIGEYINNYDVILDVCYPSLVEQELRLKKTVTKISYGVDVCMSLERRFYFNLPEVQQALHANRTKLPYTWTMCSGILNYNDNDGNINILPLLKRIINNKIPVWIFSGDQDSVVPLLGSRTLVRELAHDLEFKVTVPYGAWFHKGQVGGWVTEYGNLLTFATVRGAAHMVPYAQPSRDNVLDVNVAQISNLDAKDSEHESGSHPLYNASECPFAENSFNCLANGRRDKGYLKWRWKPNNCDILRFDVGVMLEKLCGKRVVFVGDSLSRTQWESMICMLMTGVEDKKSVYEVNGNKISKKIRYLGVRFSTHNFTVEFYRSVFLVKIGSVPKRSPKRVRSTIKLDELDGISSKWINSDILVFNTGHWWNRAKLFEIGCYFKVGGRLKLGMSTMDAYTTALNTWASWVESMIDTDRTRVFFRTFEGSHWRYVTIFSENKVIEAL
nr:serine carboxypeptidase-like 42 [Tanacetum cinerariifolium]